ncbi:MAG TPA: sigma-70 family RNA polymerase sigma factor [Planctomycetota bacterium]|nr:sigma-70 family RNA polymerase sigma factor [Planctomycetota bacterium]
MTASLPPPVLTDLLGESRWVRALAQSLVADPHDADDLAQDACVIALRNPPSHGGNVRAWLRLVMQNLLRQRARAARRREDREQRAHAGRPLAGVATDELVERATAHRAVVDAVLALAPPFRDVVLLRWFEDQPPRAIAQRLRIPVATVHSRLQRATHQLRIALDRDLGGRARWQRALLPLPSALPGLPALPALVMPLGILAMNTKVLTAVAAVIVGSAAVWIGLRSPSTAPEPALDTPAPLATGAAERGALSKAAPGERVAAAEPAPTTPPAPAAGSRQIAGRVVDADGRPASGVNVRVGDQRVPSDATGAFALASPAEGMLIARADEPGKFTVLEGVVRGGAAPPPVLVVVAPAVRLAGHVRDGRGQPVADAALQVVWPSDLRSRLRDVSDAASEQAVVTRCRQGGDFALAAGAVRGAELLASAPGHVPHRRPLPDRDEQALAIVLERLDGKPGTLQGQVVDPQGRAIANARIGLGEVLAQSDAAGNFVIEDDGRGKAVAASATGHRRAVLERGAAFPTFVLLTLGPPPLTIEGRVVDETGKGLEGIMVWPNDPTLLCSAREKVVVEGVACGNPTEGELRERFQRGEFKAMEPRQVGRTVPTAGNAWVSTGADGSFTLGGLEDRPYRLRALDYETVLMTERSGIPAGTRGVQLVLDQSQLFAEVKGVVVARRDGSPVPGVRVRVQIDTQSLEGNTRHENAVAVATTDEQGRFQLPRVPKAWAYLRLDGDKILPSEPGREHPGGLLDLSAGRPLEFRLEVGMRMHVQVELLDPQRADSIAVLDHEGRAVILNVFQGRGRTSTDQLPLAEGRSPVFVVPDTAAVLVLRKDGKEVAREPLNLRAGDVNSLRL